MKIFGLVIAKEIYMTIIIILISFVLEKVLKSIVKKTFNPKIKTKNFNEKRAKTISSLVCSIIRYVVWTLAVISLLGLYGVNTAALVTGIGVLSLVVGLAFQDILKDILAGTAILFESWYSIGDLVKVDDFTGTVMSVGLKSTKIKAYSGEVKIISNRNISSVTNYSLENTLAVVDISVAYESKLDKVEKVLQVACATMQDNIEGLVEEPEVLGVEELSDSAVVFRIVGKCKPASHFVVAREMKKELKNTLDKNGIKIPYPQIEVHHE